MLVKKLQKKIGRTTTVQTTKASSVANSTPARVTNGAVYKTDAEATKGATALGYTKTNYRTKSGAVVFKKGNSYISRDVDGHNGGAWKEASSPEKLNSKDTRNGTFDVNMNRIGD
ncbi:toxin C-terminal domain-containing protein [Faucicola boevrei]|uniref:toxin C-terminal domain-containing protein n=1 Tax=Faucicola boevrei TaxID=346665 RepID=UPI001E4DC35E|nr:toxin C-terminal domain-containing protein [Moraxella boevrei]